IL
ncbi:Malate-2H(+)/Na(+)-lactate antiporter, partial [Haemophilus influenzae]